MPRTRSCNDRTRHTHRTRSIVLACLSALSALSSASTDTVAQAAAFETRYERIAPSPDGIGKRAVWAARSLA